jgi:hypothetical protein
MLRIGPLVLDIWQAIRIEWVGPLCRAFGSRGLLGLLKRTGWNIFVPGSIQTLRVGVERRVLVAVVFVMDELCVSAWQGRRRSWSHACVEQVAFSMLHVKHIAGTCLNSNPHHVYGN